MVNRSGSPEPQSLSAATILIVDDELDLLHGLKRTLEMEMPVRVLLAKSGPEALDHLSGTDVDVLLADIQMPDMDGLTLLAEAKKRHTDLTVIIMTAYGTIERAVDAIKSGAYDFIQKPLDEARLIHLLKKGIQLSRLVQENVRLMEKVNAQSSPKEMVGNSNPMQKVFDTIAMLAQTDVNVLIRGETGTGKDLAAQAIHRASARGNRNMVIVNCPAIPESLLESELFGYVKGAFTHAERDKKGMFDEAWSSTLFLDEIGDLTPDVQTKLLRVIEDKLITPLGSTAGHRVDVRIIAATNRNLEKRMAKGRFREDLFYRLNVAVLTMPPLRTIREDIPHLVAHFLKKAAREQNAPLKTISADVMAYLLEQNWPGNIRELENTLRGWYAVTPGSVIDRKSLPTVLADCSPAAPEPDLNRPYKELKKSAIEAFTLTYLRRLFEYTQGNVSLSAKLSGMKRQSLQKIISRYRIPVDRFRD